MASWRELFGIDPRALAAFRVAIGGVLLSDLAIRAGDLAAHYTDAGVLPRDEVLAVRFPSLHMLGGSPGFEAALFALAAVAALSLCLGWRTKLATIASWVLLCSLHVRNPVLLNGGDVLLRLLVFWSMFLPLGQVWSLDARRKARRGEPASRAMVLSPGTVCILLQVCLMYWLTAYHKYNDTWIEGHGLLYSFSYDAYARPLASFLLQYPELLAGLSVATVCIEGLGPLAVFIPVGTKWIRLLVVALFVGLHVSIELTLTVGLFSYASLSAWLLFLPPMCWNWLEARLIRSGVPAELPATAPVIESPSAKWLRRGGAAVCIAAMTLVLLWSAAAVRWIRKDSEIHATLERILRPTMLRQNWGMFARPMQSSDGWCVAKAYLADGRQVDILRDGGAVTFDKPARLSAEHPNHRWRKYFRNLAHDKLSYYRGPLCRYLAQEWNAAHEATALRIDLYLIEERISTAGEPAEPVLHLLHTELFPGYSPFEESRRETEGEAEVHPGI